MFLCYAFRAVLILFRVNDGNTKLPGTFKFRKFCRDVHLTRVPNLSSNFDVRYLHWQMVIKWSDTQKRAPHRSVALLKPHFPKNFFFFLTRDQTTDLTARRQGTRFSNYQGSSRLNSECYTESGKLWIQREYPRATEEQIVCKVQMDCEMRSALSEFEITSDKRQITTFSAVNPNYAKQWGRERQGEMEKDVCLQKLIDPSICNLLPLLITPPCPLSTSPHWASTELLSNEGKTKEERKQRKKSDTETHREITQLLLCYMTRPGTIVKVNCKNAVTLRKPKWNPPCHLPLAHQTQNNFPFIAI